MNLAASAIKYRTVTLVFTVVALIGGLHTFGNLARLEDPPFTIKVAQIMTPYPGATAEEVAEEVSDALETAIQQMGQLDHVNSQNLDGLSIITVEILAQYDKTTLPQVWNELRNKVNDAASELPPGAGPSRVIDDYGDVFGVFFAVYGPEYSYAELKGVVDMLKRELLLVEDVAKIDTFGELEEVIYIEINRDRMSQLGISPQEIINEIQTRNIIVDAGRFKVGDEYIALKPTGVVSSVEAFREILINPGSDRQTRLGDIANIRRDYREPASHKLRYNGHPAIALGISTAMGGNAVTMGEALEVRIKELTDRIPLGIEFGIISLQSRSVTIAIDNFLISLYQAVAIVIIVLLFAMGLRAGLIIGFVLVLTVSATFIFMDPWNISLQRISLGALIIALGMLVDNAIVVVDGTLIRMKQGMQAKQATIEVAQQSAIPLLGATAVAVLAFAAIGTSDDSTGEFCRSLFQVVFISLGLSWVTAMTVTPLLCIMFLKVKVEGNKDPYDTPIYRGYRKFLALCMRRQWLTVAAVIGIFAVSLYSFRYVDQSFFTSSTRPQFMVDLWLPQGTHIDTTETFVDEVVENIKGKDGVTDITSLIGRGGMRFILTYNPQNPNNAYAQLLVDVDDYHKIDALQKEIEAELRELYPDVLSYVTKYQLGPGGNGLIQARFTGPDSAVLRSLADQTVALWEEHGNVKALRTDWRQQVKVIRPVVAEEQANLAGITREEIARTLGYAHDGARVGVFREGDLLIPILLRAPDEERQEIARLNALQIWSPAAKRMIPLRQVVSDFETVFENDIILREDREPTITIFTDPVHGQATSLFKQLRPKTEAIALPPGYDLEWGGEYEDSAKAQAGLISLLPFFVLMMVLIVIAMFNALRQPLIIWLTVPLAIIGVTAGLLATGQPFGFMSLLGILSLMGMLIKNAVVLIDQIDINIREGIAPLNAIIEAGVARANPVAMAAATTILGMIPLLLDAFFSAMAVTIMAGLTFATVLTLVFVPVMYALFFRVDTRNAA
ncbi:MAG: efflux RND transporter permease subunit [Gammaproteobacteria bacterium]